MSPLSVPLLAMSWLAFVASTLACALMSPAPMPVDDPFRLLNMPGDNAVSRMTETLLSPQNSMALWLLLVACWVALARHLSYVFETRQRICAARRGMHRTAECLSETQLPPSPHRLLRVHRHDLALQEHLPIITALSAGAIWPWLMKSAPLTGLALIGVMLIAALIAVIRGQRDGGRIARRSGAGLFGGWACLTAMLMLAAYAADRFGVALNITQAFAIGMIIVIAMIIQLRVHGSISFSVAIIWGLIGIAAITMPTSPSVATLAVVGIAGITLVLVLEAT